MNTFYSKTNNPHRTRRIFISCIVIAIITIPSFYFYQKNKVFTPSCTVFNPSKDLFAKMTKDECLQNKECTLSGYFAIDNLQTVTVADLGEKTNNYQELKKGGYDIYNPKSTNKDVRYGTVLESLTHGEASISANPIEFSESDIEAFNKNFIKKDFITFLRKTFDDYSSGKDISVFNKDVTETCHIVNGDTFGLKGFDPHYYKSKFIPFAIYRHVTNGYEIFILFIDKPDKLFRVWIAFDEKGNYQLRTIKDSSVPKEEIDALYKSFGKVIKDPRFSI